MTKKYKVIVDCANCASKMEDALKKDSDINNCSLSFMTQKLSVTFDDNADEKSIKNKILKICKKIDDDFELL